MEIEPFLAEKRESEVFEKSPIKLVKNIDECEKVRLRCCVVWRSGLNVHQAHDGRSKRQHARLLQFALYPWSGREAACAGAGQVAARIAGCGIYADRVAQVATRPVLARFAAGADVQADGGYQYHE